MLKTPFKFKKLYGGAPEPQTAQDAPSCRMVPETVDVGHYQAPGPKLTSQPVDRHVSDLESVALLDNHHGCRGCGCGSRPRMPVQPLMFVDRCEIARYTTQLYQLTVDA